MSCDPSVIIQDSAVDVAPISQILPSFLPIQIQQALGGYFEVPLQVEGERRLTEGELRQVIAASSFLGTQLYCAQLGFDLVEVRQTLEASLGRMPELSEEDRIAVLSLVEKFHTYPLIRADHALDDWITEAWWGRLQSGDYEYPSALSGAVSHGICIIEALKGFRIEA
jgi:hypothetical protein